MVLNGQAAQFDWRVTLEVAEGGFRFEWRERGEPNWTKQAFLAPAPTASPTFSHYPVELHGERDGRAFLDWCGYRGSSARAMLARLRKRFPASEADLCLRLVTDFDAGDIKKGKVGLIKLPANHSPWRWLEQQVQRFAQIVSGAPAKAGEAKGSRSPGRQLAWEWVADMADISTLEQASQGQPSSGAQPTLKLRVTLHYLGGFIQLDWSDRKSAARVVSGLIRCPRPQVLSWTLDFGQRRESVNSSARLEPIRAGLRQWFDRYPAEPEDVELFEVRVDPQDPESDKEVRVQVQVPYSWGGSPWDWLELNIRHMAADLSSAALDQGSDSSLPESGGGAYFYADGVERMRRREEKQAAEAARIQANMERLARERRERQMQSRQERKETQKPKPEAASGRTGKSAETQPIPTAAKAPLPPVPVHFEEPALALQPAGAPLGDLANFSLRERAALWWVSNQSDDLLCLPYCRIQRLDYQMRTALRVLGPLRGRALLSDEVGLGKTIEAGLVLKELLTRGMVKRFLVLTVPSLVDQWAEELNDKFGLDPVTTNQVSARENPESFWSESQGVVASLHTLKQPTQLAVARQVHWDILIVDEAHYLRNRESQAWQAVGALPRQFLLLLTATPVQNSLEELYNLVTLLQPGQLPTPKEFRARFLDPKRPRQPREPEELRRLLGQVMIRNTRANAGLKLPPRRAETVLFEPEAREKEFWQQWEAELRERLAGLSASQASLWGRLLLQAAGSSPAAWKDALEKFPDRAAARAWRGQTLLETSWQRKCQLLPPLTRIEGGAVVFTQFLQTQAALADYLRGCGVETFLINGSTPAAERQPITEQFQRRGGALLLTHSGTEGRNLQFSHRLANFDLPWNPMEIEQRIGRLHRLGQTRPVAIYNFVQAGTLQEHLLQILQEKLNLFELVVGETGLVLGDRFGGEEFAEEVLRRWRESDGKVAEAMAGLGDELAEARDSYGEVKKLDETLFSKDYESV